MALRLRAHNLWGPFGGSQWGKNRLWLFAFIRPLIELFASEMAKFKEYLQKHLLWTSPWENDCYCRQTGNNISAARWTFRQLNSDHSGERKREHQVMKNTFILKSIKKNLFEVNCIPFGVRLMIPTYCSGLLIASKITGGCQKRSTSISHKVIWLVTILF